MKGFWHDTQIRVDERESSRNDDGCSEIGEEREGGEVLDRTAHFSCDNGCRRSGRHDKTHEYPLREQFITRCIEKSDVGGKGEKELHRQNSPMPFMETKIQRIDFTESKKEHEENQPREYGCEGQEEFIAKRTDEHREPEGVTVEEAFQD